MPTVLIVAKFVGLIYMIAIGFALLVWLVNRGNPAGYEDEDQIWPKGLSKPEQFAWKPGEQEEVEETLNRLYTATYSRCDR